MASAARRLDDLAPMGPASPAVGSGSSVAPSIVLVAVAEPAVSARGLRSAIALPLALALTLAVLVGASSLVGSWA